MLLRFQRRYYVYIMTDRDKTRMAIGCTPDMAACIYESANRTGRPPGEEHHCVYLVYWESFLDIKAAVKREHELQSMSDKKKKQLVDTFNASWRFFNDEIMKGNTVLFPER
jgi:putative endonuclease